MVIRSNGDVDLYFATMSSGGHSGSPWSTQSLSNYANIEMGGDFRVGFVESKGAGRPLRVDVDEVAVWNRALSTAEIQAVFDLGAAGTALPEPSSLLLLLVGTVALLSARHRRHG